MQNFPITFVVVSLALVFTGMTDAHAAVDVDSAQTLMKTNNCFKCHAVDKNKKGPALRNIAAKYKGKSDAQETTIAYITTGPMVKVRDGGEESHPVIDTRDPAALQNLADWILSQ